MGETLRTAQKGMRTCIGCGSKRPKDELMRIVRTTQGDITVDPSGRKAGRGAYVCSAECLQSAYEKRKVGRALKTEFGKADAEGIAKGIEEALTSADAR